MGLDMYLYRQTYVKYWKHNGDENYEIKITKKGKPVTNIDPKKIAYIEEEIFYWRKANQIHKWFIDNCADGVDECQRIYVYSSQLKKLMNVCEQVLIESKLVPGIVKNGEYANVETDFKLKDNLIVGKVIKDFSYAAEHLPTAEGFFFGSKEYNEWYYDDVKETLEFLRELQDENGEFPGIYYYQASW